jgi:hypothetical protein
MTDSPIKGVAIMWNAYVPTLAAAPAPSPIFQAACRTSPG